MFIGFLWNHAGGKDPKGLEEAIKIVKGMIK
jgi:hypothetical protein